MAAHISYRVATLNDYSAKPSSPRTLWGLEPRSYSYAKHLWYDWTLNGWMTKFIEIASLSSDYCHLIIPNHLAKLQTQLFKRLLFRTTLRALTNHKPHISDHYVSENKNAWWLNTNALISSIKIQCSALLLRLRLQLFLLLPDDLLTWVYCLF